MVWEDMPRRRFRIALFCLGIAALVVGVHASDINVPRFDMSLDGASKVLHFPDDQCLGSLYLGPDSGFRWDTKRVCLDDKCWNRVGMAQSDLIVPASRDSHLIVSLALEKRDAALLRARNPLLYSDLVGDRHRIDPYDLSGLSTLDPNDLDVLTVNAVHPSGSVDQRVLEKISHLKGLSMLRLHGTGITDKGMKQLKSLSSLQGLELSGEKSVKSPGLASLKELPALRYLDLDTGITDAGLKPIGELSSLQWLRIRTGSIWGAGLAELANLPRLERLCLWNEGQLSDKHIRYLEGLQNIKGLTLWGGCEQLTDLSLASIGRMTSLEELHFIMTSPRFTPKGIASLKALKNLRKIDFGHATVGDEAVRHLAALAHLESIEGGLCVTAEGMKTLGTLQNLRCLRVGLRGPLQGYRGPTGISHLASLTSLEELALQGRDQSDDDLKHLEQLTSLKSLSVAGARITDRGLESIARLSQLEALGLNQTNVTKRGLNQLGRMENLRGLQVSVDSDAWGVHDETTLRLSGLHNLKSLRLSGLSLHDSDLATLVNFTELESLTIETLTLPSDALRHIKNLSRLKIVYLQGLVCSEDNGSIPLEGLFGLHDLILKGKISNAALASLADLENVNSLNVHTTEPIQRQTLDDLSHHLPGLEYLHVYSLPVPNRATRAPANRRTGTARGLNGRTPRSQGRRR